MFLSWTTQTGCRIHRTYVSLIGSGEGRHTTHLLKCVPLLSTSQTDWKQSSDVLSDISFDILSDISSDIFFWHIFWHSVWHIFWHSFWHLSDISSDIFFWHIFWHSFWHIFWHSFWTLTLFLRSSTPHSTRNIAVGVQHATLNSHYRGWGPARHTELAISRLGSSTPHQTHKIAVGVQHATPNS